MFNRILIANRGEIARRILKTCRRLGVEVVTVHSEADAGALHVREADQSVLLGPPPVAQSYLRGDLIIQAALDHGAEAVHPGYGLLSENADFARQVTEAGLVFVGPRAETIEAMGSKLRSRELAQLAGVPVLPASGPLTSDDEDGIAAAIQAIGLPVLVKLSGGGGGIGMTRVDDPSKVAKAIKKAARRGESSFGDSTTYLERAVDRGRHVEVQILADHHGKVLHLFERDCSLQRRHQKVVEEAPAPGLSDSLRSQITQAAVDLARQVGYRNAGTVEFLLGPDGSFTLLEMNTRIQVEHPVTEAITGIDLVEWQLRIACGEPLGFSQNDLKSSGHAIELRLYAEDPVRFMPAPGTISAWAEPTGEGLRLDHAVESGMEVTPFYDPMLAKLIVHGADRQESIARARKALRELVLEGITHNLPLHQRVLDSDAFCSGSVHTGLLTELNARTIEGT